ncbi:helix-turn-helix domain-containing protein [Paenibacillus sp. J5C_2022]|uniref:helix-turn-helix domain-containing protein n=1 Tax=Paenibacillus sp. J5C2022 TaxID=2977129 RepID=UPI0021D1868D|nr:helix-turn-helix domain-containing protein [Paenibacillus sp. J5C2022]MCU6709079.1 helix-turn-helix domain-containing protein [Paenibacillus sp. J5C2022]
MRTVILDDEKGIVDGLNKLIGRYVPACEIVGTAYNGISGCELIEELQPDVVITDIRMPQMDGLEMIRKLISGGSRAKFIILSGYADFQYAKRGIELGVKFFLNKPVEEDELAECLHKVMAEVNSEQAERNRMRQFVLRDMLDGGYETAADLEAVRDLLPLPAAGGQYACAIMEWEGGRDGWGDDIRQTLERALISCLRPMGQVYAFPYESGQYAVLTAHETGIDEAEWEQFIRRLHGEWTGTGLPISVGTGRVHDLPSGISLSFQEAKYALRYKVIKGFSTVLAYSTIHRNESDKKVADADEIMKLEHCIDSMDPDGCAAIVDSIFKKIEAEGNWSLADIQQQCLSILLAGMRKVSFVQLQLHDDLGQGMLSLEGLSGFRTLKQVQEWLTQALRSVIELKTARQSAGRKDVIAEIKEYVASHCGSGVTLADLSERFFINPFYLSQLFKEKTGNTYMNYVKRVRMNKAKELLETSDLKVYEICQMVGYSDTNYFSKLFEKTVGMMPSEYRRQFNR